MESIKELQKVTIDELLKFFNGPKAVRQSKDAKFSSRLAVQSLSAVARIRATDRVQDATQLTVLRDMAENKSEFKKFIAASLPHLNPVKLLDKPVK